VSDLADLLRRRIAREGPITIADYMADALGHPAFGYYFRQDPFGVDGDFITAPEISQMFGELIGLWCAATWHQIGMPPAFKLVELGPGRGTLMADALRAGSGVPGFLDAVDLHLVETSPALQARQRETLAGQSVTWHASLETLPDGPAIILANEFFDALPIHQLVRRDGVWHERMVSHAGDGFGFVLEKAPSKRAGLLAPQLSDAPDDSVAEISPASIAVANAVGQRIHAFGGAALIIDYGYPTSHPGDTLQAVRQHAFVDVLDAPGSADITAHVDFSAIARAIDGIAAVHGPVDQGAWLKRLGIEHRRDALTKTANDLQSRDIATAYHRLTDVNEMGSLFKVMALTQHGAPTPAGFEDDH